MKIIASAALVDKSCIVHPCRCIFVKRAIFESFRLMHALQVLNKLVTAVFRLISLLHIRCHSVVTSALPWGFYSSIVTGHTINPGRTSNMLFVRGAILRCDLHLLLSPRLSHHVLIVYHSAVQFQLLRCLKLLPCLPSAASLICWVLQGGTRLAWELLFDLAARRRLVLPV